MNIQTTLLSSNSKTGAKFPQEPTLKALRDIKAKPTQPQPIKKGVPQKKKI